MVRTKKLVLRPGVKQIAAALRRVKPVESNREDGFGCLLSPNCRQIFDEAEIPGDGVIDRKLGRLPCVESAGDSDRFIDGKHTLWQELFLAAAIEILPVLLIAVVPIVDDIPDVLSLFQSPAFFLAPVVMPLNDSEHAPIVDDPCLVVASREVFDAFGSWNFRVIRHD